MSTPKIPIDHKDKDKNLNNSTLLDQNASSKKSIEKHCK